MGRAPLTTDGRSIDTVQDNPTQKDVLPTHTARQSCKATHTRLSFARLVLIGLAMAVIVWIHANDLISLPRSRTVSLHPKFLHHCHQLLKPSPTTYTSRLASLSAVLRSTTLEDSESAVWVAEPGPSAFYYTGAFSSADWHLSERPFLIAVSPSINASADITFLVPEFEKLRAQLLPLPKQLEGKVRWVSWKEHESPYVVLEQALGKQRAVVLDGRVREFVAAGVRETIGEQAVRTGEGIKAEVVSIRERKDEREIELLHCANQMTLHAIRKTRSKMKFGMTESRTGQILNAEMLAVGLKDGDGLVLFGENAALPHGSGTDRKLTKNDLILIDAGGKWGGYVADITRTFALPKSQISNHHLRIWETVRRAQLAPYDLLLHPHGANLTFADLDIAARAVVSRAFPPSNTTNVSDPDYSVFTHRLGHGIGLEGHESPYVVQGPQGAGPVKSGHVFSLEPGVYLPRVSGAGEGVGVRLEDCFVVTEGKDGKLGGRWLSGPVRSWGQI